MTLKILALILSLIGMTVALRPSDAYEVGYAEGRFDLHTESRAIKKFHECVVEKKKEPAWTKVLYRSWDAMTDQQKVDHVAQSTGWSKVVRCITW